MSGHSKWATIKRAKAATDAKKSAVFTKFANNIAIAARKGPDPNTNFSLRLAIDKAKGVNMPKDSIEKAVKRGSGGQSEDIEELQYEALGPNNTQFIVKCLTNNKNRSASEIRHLFTKHEGGLGAVSWNFEQLGVTIIDKTKPNVNFEELELELIDQGANDIQIDDESITIHSNVKDLQNIKKLLEEKDIETQSAQIEYVAKEKTTLTEESMQKIEKLTDALEENEDIAEYYSNIA